MGGASFKILVRGDHFLHSCTYSDHFNGSYDAFCPLYDAKSIISIRLIFTNFDAFRPKKTYFRQLLWKQIIKLPENCSQDVSNYTGWFRATRHMSWQWKAGHESLLSESRCKVCLRRFDGEIVFIGDSHARLTYYYLLSLLDLFSKEFHHFRNDFEIGLLSYTRAYHIVELFSKNLRPLGLRPSLLYENSPDFDAAVMKWRNVIRAKGHKDKSKRKTFFVIEIGS